MPQDNLYEQFIRQTVAEFYPQARPRIQVSRTSVGLDWLAERGCLAGRGLSVDLLRKLLETSREAMDLESYFVLNSKVDHSRAYDLELDGMHYSQQPVKCAATIRFGFSPVASDEKSHTSLFYATYNRGFLAGAGLLSLAGGDDMKITATHCLWTS